MNIVLVSTFDCSFEYFEKFEADSHEKEGYKYIDEYERIKVKKNSLNT